jgi:hypothetical protein
VETLHTFDGKLSIDKLLATRAHSLLRIMSAIAPATAGEALMTSCFDELLAKGVSWQSRTTASSKDLTSDLHLLPALLACAHR